MTVNEINGTGDSTLPNVKLSLACVLIHHLGTWYLNDGYVDIPPRKFVSDSHATVVS